MTIYASTFLGTLPNISMFVMLICWHKDCFCQNLYQLLLWLVNHMVWKYVYNWEDGIFFLIPISEWKERVDVQILLVIYVCTYQKEETYLCV